MRPFFKGFFLKKWDYRNPGTYIYRVFLAFFWQFILTRFRKNCCTISTFILLFNNDSSFAPLESPKFALPTSRTLDSYIICFFKGMYALTYIGKMFNGLTLIIIAWVTIFSAPKIYRDNQVLINNFVISFFKKGNDNATILFWNIGKNWWSSVAYQREGGRFVSQTQSHCSRKKTRLISSLSICTLNDLLSSNKKPLFPQQHIVWKLLKMSQLNFGIFHQFLSH